MFSTFSYPTDSYGDRKIVCFFCVYPVCILVPSQQILILRALESTLCISACSSGKYGERCSRNCSGNCEIDSYDCNHINGSCPDGCQAGWEGSTCDQGDKLISY